MKTLYGETISYFLSIQYRMHPSIMQWASDAMYNGLLKGYPSVDSHLLPKLQHVQDTEETKFSLILIDTAGCQCVELVDEDGSRYNPSEAQLVETHLGQLVQAGVRVEDIAIITPYNAQVSYLYMDRDGYTWHVYHRLFSFSRSICCVYQLYVHKK